MRKSRENYVCSNYEIMTQSRHKSTQCHDRCRSMCTIVILSSYFTWKHHVLFSRLDTWARKSCVTRVPGSSRVVGLAYTTFADNAQIIVLFTVTWSDSDMAGGSQNGMGGGMCTRILFTKPKPNCTAAHHRILDWCPGEVLYPHLLVPKLKWNCRRFCEIFIPGCSEISHSNNFRSS